MYNFILQIITMLSLGAVIYLIARVVPRVTEIEAPIKEPGFFDKLIKKIPLEKIDAVMSGLLEKLLRKFKVVILRLDNIVSKHLHSIRTSNADSMAGVKPALFDGSASSPRDGSASSPRDGSASSPRDGSASSPRDGSITSLQNNLVKPAINPEHSRRIENAPLVEPIEKLSISEGQSSKRGNGEGE